MLVNRSLCGHQRLNPLGTFCSTSEDYAGRGHREDTEARSFVFRLSFPLVDGPSLFGVAPAYSGGPSRGGEVLLAVSHPHAGNCLSQLQVSSGGPMSDGVGHEPHLCLENRLQENLTDVRTRSNVFIWAKVGLDMGFAFCDEILS